MPEQVAELIVAIVLLVAVAWPLIAINRFWRTTGIWTWHHHNGRMRRKLRDGSFEHRQASPGELLDQIDREAW
jgi:hypothetical protein